MIISALKISWGLKWNNLHNPFITVQERSVLSSVNYFNRLSDKAMRRSKISVYVYCIHLFLLRTLTNKKAVNENPV